MLPIDAKGAALPDGDRPGTLPSHLLDRSSAHPGGAPHALAVAILASFVGFHLAGLVEYNFADSEVLEIFFVIMGLGLAPQRRTLHAG